MLRAAISRDTVEVCLPMRYDCDSVVHPVMIAEDTAGLWLSLTVRASTTGAWRPCSTLV